MAGQDRRTDNAARGRHRLRSHRPAGIITALVIVTALIFTAATACGSDDTNRIVPSGNVESQDVEVEGFTRIEAGATFLLEISQGDEFAVQVTADDNLLPLVEVGKKGKTLTLGIKGPVSIDGNADLSAAITLPALESLELDGATRATLNGFREPANVYIGASGASWITGELSAGSITIVLSGSSGVSLEGFALRGDLQASGASKLELFDFDLAEASIEVSGASSAEVSVREKITTARASGASRITYEGEPKIGNLDVSGSSSVSQH